MTLGHWGGGGGRRGCRNSTGGQTLTEMKKGGRLAKKKTKTKLGGIGNLREGGKDKGTPSRRLTMRKGITRGKGQNVS